MRNRLVRALVLAVLVVAGGPVGCSTEEVTQGLYVGGKVLYDSLKSAKRRPRD